MSRPTNSCGMLVVAAATGTALLVTGCTQQAPDIGAFAEAVKWLGGCLVVSSLIWAIGIVLFGRSRK